MLTLLMLILWPLIIFVFINLLILPFSFTIRSVFSIFTIPGEIIKIAFNKRLRQNHALEHATINVIEEHYGKGLGLSGLAKENGFFIKGPVEPQLVEKAAAIGLERLKMGEHHLAIHDNCGTSMAMANFVSSAAFLILLFKTGAFNIFNVFIALIIANLFGPLLGRVVQHVLTTSTDVSNVSIVGIDYNFVQPQGLLFFRPVVTGMYFVRTRMYRMGG